MEKIRIILSPCDGQDEEEDPGTPQEKDDPGICKAKREEERGGAPGDGV